MDWDSEASTTEEENLELEMALARVSEEIISLKGFLMKCSFPVVTMFSFYSFRRSNNRKCYGKSFRDVQQLLVVFLGDLKEYLYKGSENARRIVPCFPSQDVVN